MPSSQVAEPRNRLSHPVLIADRPATRHHRTEDLVDLALCGIAISLVVILGIYAHGTTTAVTEDVRSALADILRQILLLPVTLLESVFVLIIPIGVIVELFMHRRLRSILEAIATGATTILAVTLLTQLLPLLPSSLTSAWTITSGSQTRIVIDALIATFVAFVTAAGEASQQRSIRYSWAFIFILALLYVMRGSMTLPAATITILVGRAIGCGARYLFGFNDNRGSGLDLVHGLLSVGITPAQIIRADLPTDTTPLITRAISEDASALTWAAPYLPLTYVEVPADAAGLRQHQINTLTPSPNSTDRHYVCVDTQGDSYDLIVLDPETQITSLIHDLWNNVRLRGLTRWIAPSLHANAERSTLVKMAAHQAGVITPRIVGITAAGASVFTIQKPVPNATTLRSLNPERLTDEVLDRIVTQLHIAHTHAIAHRSLDLSSIALDNGDRPWIVNWEEGQVASSSLTRRIDMVQLVVTLALKVGPRRALAAVRRIYGAPALTLAGTVMQRAILPQELRKELRKHPDLLGVLREEVSANLPEGDAPEITITRFSARTVIMAVLAVIALWIVLGSLNFSNITDAVLNANPWWMLIAFGFSLVTYLGAAIPVVAYTPEKIRLWDATLTQVAASIVTVVAPAGIGPAAVNLRFLNRRGIDTPLAVATVAFIQASQFVVTLATLLIVLFTTGRSTQVELPSSSILIVVSVLTVGIGVTVAIPQVRRWAWKRLQPTWTQIWQRLVWVIGQPRRLAYGIAGNLLMTVCFILTFTSSLAAFGYTLDPTTLTVTYLASNTLGSVIPSPGGIGPVEAALTGGLTVAGVPSGIAISAALLYRLVTFYGRLPLGWIGLRIMTKQGKL